MRAALLLIVSLLGSACATPAPVAVREVRVRPDRRLLRENRALRREVRALREELAQARSVATTESETRRQQNEAQTAIVTGLGAQIRELTRSIELLERSVRPPAEPPVAPARSSRRPGTFGKLRVGVVPAQSPTPPEPRDRMDAPERPPVEVRQDLLDPFTKGAAPSTVP